MKKYTPSLFAQLVCCRKLLLAGLFFVCGLCAPNLRAQCSNDLTPPTPQCQANLVRDVSNAGPIVVTAQEFNNGSTDNCTPSGLLQFFIQEGTPSAQPPATTSLSFTSSQVGAHNIVLWAVDTAGNSAYCTSTLQLNFCTQSLVCNDQITIQLDANNTGVLTPFDGLEGGPYCSFYTFLVRLDPLTGGAPAAPSIALGPQHIGTHLYEVKAPQIPNSCWGNVTILGNSCQNDQTLPVAACNNYVGLTIDTTQGPTVLLTPQMLNAGCSDNCTPAVDLDFRLEPNNGMTGPPPSTTTLTLGLSDLGTHPVTLWVGDQAGNWSACWANVNLSIIRQHLVLGTVFGDANADCQRQSAQENGLAGWEVRATGLLTGEVFAALTNAQGYYKLAVDTIENDFEVALNAPLNYGGACGTTYTVHFPILSISDTVLLDIPVKLDADCPSLFVDLATLKIRPCFPGTYYVQYANASTTSVADTYVDVTLDPALTFQGSTLPATPLGGQQYRFQTGDLDPGESGWFSVNFTTDCDVPLGATHCSEAHIFPDTICPMVAAWSGANVEVSGACIDDSIHLEIKNTGTAPNAQPLDFIVVEDVLMLESGNFSLGAGEVYTIPPIAGNGATYRLQAEQEPGHPYGGMPAVAVEGCNGFTPGMVTLFAINNANPFIATDCRENTNSFDPNDKQALPRGYTAEHLIEANTPLDYTIRFQNTGTDTAYQVVLVDTLSSALAASAVRPGASSHPYRFELLDGHILRFTFDHILLPDSSVNAAASQGFVQFKAPQRPGNPDGTRIENTAAIYFDANAPVLTNRTWHTVGSHFILVSTNPGPANATALAVYPNPAGERVTFDAKAWTGGPLRFTLTDAQGRVARERADVALPLTLERGGLASGLYFFRFASADGKVVWSGTVAVR